jgi:hydroxyethylthiazole kinase-like uncharacterized protein yjeF
MHAFPHGTPVYTTQEIRRLEALAAALPAAHPLMERAGLAAATLARDLAGSGKPVLVLAGPGNNGGDAFVIARYLRSWWFNVSLVFAGATGKLPADAAAALQAWRETGGTLLESVPPGQQWGLIVDGLFGIGLTRDLDGPHAALVNAVNADPAPVLAIDVPSGIGSDTGRAMGCAIRARHTITFIGLKPGLLTLDGVDHCGEIHLATLDVDAASLLPPRGSIIGSEILRRALPPRALNTHKGDYGSIGIIGGDDGMVGAALLAGRAALKLGSGRVYVGLIANDAPAVDFIQPELMLREADSAQKVEQLVEPLSCLAIGPGLGQSPRAQTVLETAMRTGKPLVIDADGLNLLSRSPSIKIQLKQIPTVVLTPHPAEAARLLGCTTAAVQADRLAAALRLAQEWSCSVVLKGAGSICALKGGSWAINPSGNPGMASAGMGDVLTGIIASLIGQGAAADTALLAGVYLHGAAADALLAEGAGPLGLTASEVTTAARHLLNQALGAP